jgi:integrase
MAAAAGTTRPRRTRTKAPGVFRSSSGSYEIHYRDSDGRLVQRTVTGGFEDAKAARAEIVGKLSRGEPIRRSKATFGDFAETVFAGLGGRPRTLEKHRYNLDRHLLPRFRGRRLGDITTDDVAQLVTEMGRGVYLDHVDGRPVRKQRDAPYAGRTIAGVLATLSIVMGKAKRKGLIPANPVTDLERGERPNLAATEKRVLDDVDLAKLLDEGGPIRPLLAVLAFSGLRIGETLGLQWRDVGDGFLHVRRQLGRDRQVAAIKTAAGRRDVVLMPQLAAVLAEHRLASLHCSDTDFVFPTAAGRGRDHHSTARAIRRAVERAGLGAGVSAHNLRHTFASQLIVGLGLDPVRVSKQLGHTNAGFTASTYAHLFEHARHADELRDRMADGYGRLLDVNAVSTGARNGAQPEPPKVAAISRSRGWSQSAETA